MCIVFLLLFFRKHAITKLAKLLECTRIITAENEHKLSIRLLSNVALGRGSQIGLDIVKNNILLCIYVRSNSYVIIFNNELLIVMIFFNYQTYNIFCLVFKLHGHEKIIIYTFEDSNIYFSIKKS
jgi:hypothetical protein